jgi:hypothetical protein
MQVEQITEWQLQNVKSFNECFVTVINHKPGTNQEHRVCNEPLFFKYDEFINMADAYK